MLSSTLKVSVYLAILWEPITDVTEAAGSTGRELLFQATSEQMIDAYSRVPRCSLEFLQFPYFTGAYFISKGLLVLFLPMMSSAQVSFCQSKGCSCTHVSKF